MRDEESTTYTAHSVFEYEYNCRTTGFDVAMKGFQSVTSVPNDSLVVRIIINYICIMIVN